MEWEQVVDAWQFDTWESYRDVMRLKRKTPVKEPQRAIIWSIFERVKSAAQVLRTGLLHAPKCSPALASFYANTGVLQLLTLSLLDEANKIQRRPAPRFLAALGGAIGETPGFSQEIF